MSDPRPQPVDHTGGLGAEPPAPVALDLARSRTIALDAWSSTPQNWHEGRGWVYSSSPYVDDNRLANVLGMRFTDPEHVAAEAIRAEHNARHIAEFDPPMVLTLLDRSAALEAENAALRHDAGRGLDKGATPAADQTQAPKQ